MQFGMGMPVVQQVPDRAAAWERGAGSAELVAVARAADRLGFAWITCSDHVAVPATYASSMGPTWFEPVATLGYLAAVTERVRLLSHVMVLPYRHPLLIAKAFATLDRLSRGRVILGVGSGHLKPEFRTLGAAFEERDVVTEEAIRAIAAALESDVSSFAGSFTRWRDMMVSPTSVQRPRPPLWVGGNGRAALRRAVRLADGWIPWELELDQFRNLSAFAREQMEETQRSDGLELIAPLGVDVDDSMEQVRERVAVWSAAGATGFHLGFRHRSLEHLIERMKFFSRDVIAGG